MGTGLTRSFDEDALAEGLLQRTITSVYGQAAKELVSGKRVLVTGAGGSIGSEIARQLKKIDPQGEVYFVDNSEYALYALEMSLTSRPLLTEPEYVLADVSNRMQMHKIISEIRPDIVFHAAAYKQLPLLERSPENAIRTNVLGTEVIAESCALNDVACLVNISTDKAARPTSILGMTKRLAEMIVASYANERMKVASVRFGNVLNSRGSFIETLQYQIDNGLPITITDQRMDRYFMSIPEAAGLVIEVSTLANNGSTYVLDMGEPIKILDIVQRYVEMRQTKAPQIIITGARKGEKISEDLLDTAENLRETSHPRIKEVDVPAMQLPKDELDDLYRIITVQCPSDKLRDELERLISLPQSDLSRPSRKMAEILSS